MSFQGDLDKRFGRRTFLQLSGLAGAAIALRPLWNLGISYPEISGFIGDRSTARLDQTIIRNNLVWRLQPIAGRVDISAALAVPKSDPQLNYGWKRPGEIPGNLSELMYSSIRAIEAFGTRQLRSGETLTYMDLIRTREGGYVGSGFGKSHVATALSEIFGTMIELSGGEVMPLFVTPRNGIQLYGGESGYGVVVNENGPLGQLLFGINPYLLESTQVTLGLSYVDTLPENPRAGEFRATVNLEMAGLPSGCRVFYQRFTENPEAILKVIVGSNQSKSSGASPYFDADRKMRRVEGFSTGLTAPREFVRVESGMQVLFESFGAAARVPPGNANKLIFPDGFARHAQKIANGEIVWAYADDWLYLSPADLPPEINQVSMAEYWRILNWGNVASKNNKRYFPTEDMVDTFCTVRAKDLGQAYRIVGYPYGAPVPGWYLLPGWHEKLKLSATNMWRWFVETDEASLLGWQRLTPEEAQVMANNGFLTMGVALASTGGRSHVAAACPGRGKVVDGIFYPQVTNVGADNWGPGDGRTAFEGFYRLIKRGVQPLWFTWIPPEMP